jgi:hypothetical protein
LTDDENTCLLCKHTIGLREFAITVDGQPLRVVLTLCQDHGDEFLLRCGRAIGALLRDNATEVDA